MQSLQNVSINMGEVNQRGEGKRYNEKKKERGRRSKESLRVRGKKEEKNKIQRSSSKAYLP